MDSYKNGQLIYHLTSLENMPSILKNGLLPRNQLEKFDDIADNQILEHRSAYNLNKFVPFHFFPKNPFDDGVQKAHVNKTFVIITLKRSYARMQGFRIIPQHPLSLNPVVLYDYDDGIELINWDKMNERNYFDWQSKQVCMAECIIDRPIMPQEFSWIFVKDDKTKKEIERLDGGRYNLRVSISYGMFVSIT